MKTLIRNGIALGLLSVSALAFAQPVVLINTFSGSEKHDIETLAYWDTAREILSEQSGYISTTLHRSLNSDSTYRYINVAQWQSQQHFVKAIRTMQKELPAIDINGVTADPNLYEVIRN